MARPRADRPALIAKIAEVFREHGYEGASLTSIEAATGLGKGSLYHFFPNGKEQMAAEVVADISLWFEENLFTRLAVEDHEASIGAMFDVVSDYFRSGRRVCLVGAMALSDGRDRFADLLRSYFARWVETLTQALLSAGMSIEGAAALAEEIVQGLQGAIVLARARRTSGVRTSRRPVSGQDFVGCPHTLASSTRDTLRPMIRGQAAQGWNRGNCRLGRPEAEAR